MATGDHEHTFVQVVRMRGTRVRRKCVYCRALGPWTKHVPVPKTNPMFLRELTVQQLRDMAKEREIRGTSKLNKAQLIERLTEVS